MQRGLRRLLGFDFVHAWRNREGLWRSDVVWTHTEREYLAALTLWLCKPWRRRPKLIAQTIWLFDRWPTLSALRRAIYLRLMRRADLLTTLSPENLRVARRLFPDKRCELVRFGVEASALRPVSRLEFHDPIRIVSLGTDFHRDWDTLVEALGGWKPVSVRIAGLPKPNRRIWPDNLAIVRPKTAKAIYDLYKWADLVVIPLKPNLHASGITVLFEAVASGVPAICTDSGGLRAYFSDQEVGYVAPGNPSALRAKILEFAADSSNCHQLAVRAQHRILTENLTARAYAMRHRELSQTLLH